MKRFRKNKLLTANDNLFKKLKGGRNKFHQPTKIYNNRQTNNKTKMTMNQKQNKELCQDKQTHRNKTPKWTTSSSLVI